MKVNERNCDHKTTHEILSGSNQDIAMRSQTRLQFKKSKQKGRIYPWKIQPHSTLDDLNSTTTIEYFELLDVKSIG